MSELLRAANELFEYSRAMRRDFHLHPELGFQEIRTAGIVSQELQALGLEVTTGVGKTGVVGILEGAKPGGTLLLRADMDALPILEQTGAGYASQTAGVMHACGHDGHTAILLTVARLLTERREELAGTIKFVFQPAEEGMGGAEGMIAEGVMLHPKVDAALGLHLWNEKPLGWLGVAAGPIMAGAEEFSITITGKGGHGAIPHLSQDPVLAGAHIVTALQAVVSRNVSPLKPAVVSVTTFHAGEAFNVIPPHAELTGTIRTFEPEVRETVLRRFDETVHGIASAMGCAAEVHMHPLTAAVINDAAIANVVQGSARAVAPDMIMSTEGHVTMGAEDFSSFLKDTPGAFFFVGSANPSRGLDFGHHHPKFDFDEEALPVAAAVMARAALDILNWIKE